VFKKITQRSWPRIGGTDFSTKLFFFLVEHSPHNFNVANNSQAMQGQEFCSKKIEECLLNPCGKIKLHVTTNPQKKQKT